MINKVVKDGIKDNNVASVRSSLAMLAYMANSESHEDFVDSIEYAEQRIAGLYEKDDNCNYSDDEISQNNYIKIAKLLIDNFSQKKCASLVKIGNKLFNNGLDSPKKLNVKNSNLSSNNLPQFDWKKYMPTIFIIIVVIILFIVKLFHR